MGTYLLFAMLAIVACSEQPRRYPSLPSGVSEASMPTLNANALVYLNSPGSQIDPAVLGVKAGTVGQITGARIGFTSILGALTDFGRDYQLIIAMEDAQLASSVKDSILISQGALNDRASVRGNQLRLERTGTDNTTISGTKQVRRPSQSMAVRYPEVWEILQGFPDKPPMNPIATGFIMQLEGFLDALISKNEIQIPGVSDGLGLLRTGPIVFIAYSDDLGVLPGPANANVLHSLQTGVIVCVRSKYPGFITELVAQQFIQRLDLFGRSTEFPKAFYGRLDANLHVMIHVIGSDIFIAASGSGADVVALIQSVRSH